MKRSNGERKTNPQEYRHRKRGREEEVRLAASQGTEEGQEDIVDKSKYKKQRTEKTTTEDLHKKIYSEYLSDVGKRKRRRRGGDRGQEGKTPGQSEESRPKGRKNDKTTTRLTRDNLRRIPKRQRH